MSTIADDPQFTSYRGGGRRVQIANSFGVLRQSRQFMKMCRKYKIKGCRHISIIIGNDDEVVNPIKTYNWLTKNKPVINIEMIDGMGHRFDLETFTKFTQPILNMDFI